MAERSLTEFADSIVAIETASPVTRPPKIELGPSFARIGLQADVFAPRTHSVGLNRYDVSDVTLHGNYLTLLKDGAQVSETNYCVHPVEWENAPIFPPPEDRKRVLGDTRVVIGCNRNFFNYYHWIAQAAPAIDHAFRAPSDRPLSLALPEKLSPALPQKHDDTVRVDTLKLLGHGDVGLLQVSEHETYLLPHARYSDFLPGRTAFQISCAARETFRKLAAAVPNTPTGHDAIYVARTDSQHRRMLNELAMIEMMRRHGVSIVEAGTMTLAQQINLFRNAQAVIGAHGAGLTNIAFCRPGAVVYELGLESYPNACFNLLAQAGGLEYWGDLFPAIEQPGDIQSATWEADLGVVEQRLHWLPLRGAHPFSAPVAALAPTVRAQASPSVRLGIGVATFNRAETLLRTLDRIRELTGRPHELVVADDGSGDGTQDRLRAAGVACVAGRNMGVAWNKNRALFHLCAVKACEIVILLEDDTQPSEQDWQERWVAAALRWGHVNIAGDWFRESFVGGTGTAEDPILSKDVSAQCSVFTRECLMFGGYMDPRFRGFGFEHVEHSWRLARLGFGGDLNLGGGGSAPLFKLISGGVEVRHGHSAGSPEQVDRNRALCHRIMWEEHFRAPWTNDAEMIQFRTELASVEAAPQSGKP